MFLEVIPISFVLKRPNKFFDLEKVFNDAIYNLYPNNPGYYRIQFNLLDQNLLSSSQKHSTDSSLGRTMLDPALVFPSYS